MAFKKNLSKVMKSKKNRKNRSSNKIKNAQPEEKRRDGQCKTGEHIAESSESSNRDKSGQIYLLERSLLDKIIRNLNGFSDLLSIQLHPDDVKRPILECHDVTKRLMNLPEYSDEDSGEVFIKLTSGLKEKILDALVDNYDLAWKCLETSKEVRMKRVIRNDGLVTRLNALTFSVSKCEDDQKHCDDRVKHRDGQFKKTEHLAESSESSNRDNSKLTYKVDQSLRDEIIDNLHDFSKALLFSQLDAADEEELSQDSNYVYMRVWNLPANSDEHLRPDDLFIELASDVKDEILSALVANRHLMDVCFEKSLLARLKRINWNQRLINKLKKLPISVSKCAAGQLSKDERTELAEVMKILDLGNRGPMTMEQVLRTTDFVAELVKQRVEHKKRKENAGFDLFAVRHHCTRTVRRYGDSRNKLPSTELVDVKCNLDDIQISSID